MACGHLLLPRRASSPPPSQQAAQWQDALLAGRFQKKNQWCPVPAWMVRAHTAGWSPARARPAATGDSFEAPRRFHTAQLRHPTAKRVSNAHTESRKHLWKRAPRPFPSCRRQRQRPAGAGGALAQTPAIKTIRSRSIRALLSATPCAGLAAKHRGDNNCRCGRGSCKLCPCLSETHSPTNEHLPAKQEKKKNLLPASRALRGKHALHRSFFQRSDANRDKIPDCKINNN